MVHHDHQIFFGFDFHKVKAVKISAPRPYGEGADRFVARTIELLDSEGKILPISLFTEHSSDPVMPVTVSA